VPRVACARDRGESGGVRRETDSVAIPGVGDGARADLDLTRRFHGQKAAEHRVPVSRSWVAMRLSGRRGRVTEEVRGSCADGCGAAGCVRERDDVVVPPRCRCSRFKRTAAVDGVTVFVAPGEGRGSESLVAGGVVEPQVTKSWVRQGDPLEEATLGGLDAKVSLGEACAGEGHRADGANAGVDGNLAAGMGNRDAMVAVVDEVQFSHPDQRQGCESGAGLVV
jgi:hypothetical protein